MKKWIIEIAYCLTSASEGTTRSPEVLEHKAPYWRGHDDAFFATTMRECGFETTLEQRNKAIDLVWAIRKRLNWWGLRNIDKMGTELGVTSEIRREAGARLVGAIGETKASRRKARQQRKKESKMAKRRKDGCMTRAEYEEKSLSKTRPWEAMGVSRATFYRRNRETSETNSETTSLPARQVRGQRIKNDMVGSIHVSTRKTSRTPKVVRRSNTPLVSGNVLALCATLAGKMDVPQLSPIRLGTVIQSMNLSLQFNA